MSNVNDARVNLLGMDRTLLAGWLSSQGEKPFRADQILPWIHRHLLGDFAPMSDLAQTLRRRLQNNAAIIGPTLETMQSAGGGDGTQKWLVRLHDGNAVETVFIPGENRGTLCISTQVGCAMACTFCATGYQGLSRHLSSDEIVGQLWSARRLLDDTPQSKQESLRAVITNVVLMGMGEPLANLPQVLPALRLMLDDRAYGLSRRRVTVSTVGWIPGIEELARECPVALALSLHAPNDNLRDQLVPVNRKYPLKKVFEACRRYAQVSPRGFITLEYVMLGGVNDDDQCLRQLLSLARTLPCKVNLIPFNPIPQAKYQPSTPQRLRAFSETLWEAGLCTTVRKARGDEIQAACGQLAGQVQRRRVHAKTTARVISVQSLPTL